jgi:hypothetical protein
VAVDDRPVMIAATAAEAMITAATIARLMPQRRRPPRRGVRAGRTGLAGAGPDAQATSWSKPVGADVVTVGGVNGAVGGAAAAGGFAAVGSGVGTRLVASSAAGPPLVVSRSSVIVIPSAGSSPARQRADGCSLAAAG